TEAGSSPTHLESNHRAGHATGPTRALLPLARSRRSLPPRLCRPPSGTTVRPHPGTAAGGRRSPDRTPKPGRGSIAGADRARAWVVLVIEGGQIAPRDARTISPGHPD